LLAGIDLLTGQVHALVKDRHRSREFVEFLSSSMPLSGPYGDQAGSRQSFRAHLQGDQGLAREHLSAASNSPSRPSTAPAQSRRGFFSKLARSVLRHIRVASKRTQGPHHRRHG